MRIKELFARGEGALLQVFHRQTGSLHGGF